MLGVAGAAAWFGLTQYLAVAVMAGVCFEVLRAVFRSKKWRPISKLFLFSYSLILLFSTWSVGAKPFILLLLLMIISAADIGAYFVGRRIGGDKMWPSVSPGKTWSGQIAGIVCGAAAGVMYGLLGTDVFLPSLMWIGIGVALLSQYGDLALSAIKRRAGIKDFGRILPGHGGLADRFDGWVFVLPIVWWAIS
jgi:phosphatidate cytidylyltransferase